MKKFKGHNSSRPSRPARSGAGRGAGAGGSAGRGPSRAVSRGGAASVASSSGAPLGRCVVGIHAVEELLRVRPRATRELWLRENFQVHSGLQALREIAEQHQVRVQIRPVGQLDKIVSAHQGVLAFASADPELDFAELCRAPTATVVALDEVEDPHNLGAVLRTTWLLGGAAVLTPEHRSATLSPAVSKVAQGAVEHVPVLRDGALPQQLEAFKREGFWLLGLAGEATQSLYKLEIPEKVVWVLGSEAGGLRKSVAGVCDELIAIPQIIAGASYNVSVAAALALGETFRQRHSKA